MIAQRRSLVEHYYSFRDGTSRPVVQCLRRLRDWVNAKHRIKPFFLHLMVWGFPTLAFAEPPKIWIGYDSSAYGLLAVPASNAIVTDGHRSVSWGMFGPDLRALVSNDAVALTEAERAVSKRREAIYWYIPALAGFGIFVSSALVVERNIQVSSILFFGGAAISIPSGILSRKMLQESLRSTYRAINIYNGVPSSSVEVRD